MAKVTATITVTPLKWRVRASIAACHVCGCLYDLGLMSDAAADRMVDRLSSWTARGLKVSVK